MRDATLDPISLVDPIWLEDEPPTQPTLSVEALHYYHNLCRAAIAQGRPQGFNLYRANLQDPTGSVHEFDLDELFVACLVLEPPPRTSELSEGRIDLLIRTDGRRCKKLSLDC